MACECETYGYCPECRRANGHWVVRPELIDKIDEQEATQEAIAELVARIIDRLWPEAGEVRP